MTVLIPLVVLIPLAGAALALAVPGHRRLQQGITLVALSSVLVLSGTLMWLADSQGAMVMEVGGWAAPFGIALVVDRVSALMLTISSIVLLGVFLFSIGQGLADGDEDTPVSIYYPTYLVLGAGVFNAFIAGDLFNLYVGFEILLVASYVLITLGGTAQRIRAGVTYVIVSLVSSVLFLAAIGLIYGATGTVNMAQLTLRIAELPSEVQLLLNLMLLIAFGIKAAVFPLSFWLPDSYPTAPAPVTAVFAGLLTKVGVYAIIRTQTLLFPNSSVDLLLLIVAGLTLIVGILGAVSQLDIKRLLSFTLISHIGYMIFGIGMANAAGFGATIFYIAHHIIVQTTLFLAVGLIERHGGTTSLSGLGGMLRTAPVIAVLFFIPMLNLGGIPPFSGFIGKLGLFTVAAELATPAAYWLMGIGALVSLLTLYALARAWVFAFWRPRKRADAAADTGKGKSPSTEAMMLREREEALFEQLHDAPDAVPQQEQKEIPRLMIAATAGMVVVSVALTVFAGPLYAYADRAGENMAEPGRMVELVLGDSPGQLGGGSGVTRPGEEAQDE
ncbi:Na+/H+ antiporter subunit D [Leucobacter luti]|uniref:Multisubunit sodium/proton antiporter MrpD subunit n=1 Tax=Leucobacter luti TaxID=340320 RepID=A0A4R6RZT2_9MICO|nr:Na+/H+ antiporter subunit D [Leucobacter luti]MCW2287540.1 multicomponent Na+:H+ antiporter subunit D [Leucobacter luti]QYM76423.1 Na+/H+ antiporter subunit D [Leucobacter luti]TCK46293.1 multisubunit sodium/proton antiporter MrpD subunit [Leucobacter luti]TDP92722.1 multisubunit sodium/proton antiporter MrpD subunit [Leucobacter luti]